MFSPAALCFVLLLAGFLLHRWKRSRASAICLGLAIGVLFIGGNGWVVKWSIVSLEDRYCTPNPMPQADCILVLGGGIMPKEPPRQSIEVSEAGDRVLYAARLYKEGKAPLILFAGGNAPGSTSETTEAGDAREFLGFLGVPAKSILVEDRSSNTHENMRNSRRLILEKGFKRLLLVTSALHMPRALAVARRQMPDIEVVPAPTDYLVTESKPEPLLRQFASLVPTGARLMQIEAVIHEYIGMLYYKARGWM